MRKPTNRNENGVLLTVEQAAQRYNLGLQTVRKVAEESGSVIRIGRTYRINVEKFMRYVTSEYQVAE